MKIKNKAASALKLLMLWTWGGAVYSLCELLWRGYSHPSMFVVGGLCFLIIGAISHLPYRKSGFFMHTLLGTAAVTVVELISGLVLNRTLELGIWDYSKLPFNLWGQICPQYIAAWMPLTAVGVALNGLLRCALFGESMRYLPVLGMLKRLEASLKGIFNKTTQAAIVNEQFRTL